MSDFGGWGFAMGSVRGHRVWRVDALGRLTGVTYKKVWTPGENESACLAGESQGYITGMVGSAGRIQAYISAYDPTFRSTYFTPPPPPLSRYEVSSDLKVKHKPESCQCGYYAYFAEQDTNPYDEEDQPIISGVIDAYGKVVLGGKGFRAEKAKITALCIPDDRPAVTQDYRRRVARNYPDVPMFSDVAEMLAAYPIEANPGLDLTPETADDFWTREVPS